MPFLRMTDLDLAGKRVLIREDLNVPVENGKISSDARIRAALPTLERAAAAGASVMVISHLGRPKEGEVDPGASLEPVARRLAELTRVPVRFENHWLGGVDVAPGEIVVCENVRFNRGEKDDDEALARRMAGLCDIFVMDAFGTAHRAHASTHGIARFAAVACAGPLLAAEVDALSRALENPARPLLAVVGGSKVSTKLGVLESLVERVDQLIVGGGIANTFLLAAGFSVGRSLAEPDLVDEAKRIASATEVPLPTDVVVAKSMEGAGAVKSADAVANDEMILDIGPQTAATYARTLQDAGTIVWNGPVGVFEKEAFAKGTRALAQAIAGSQAFSIAGGGDTVAAIHQFGVAEQIDYISTAGGAFLEFLEGKTLPAVAILEERA